MSRSTLLRFLVAVMLLVSLAIVAALTLSHKQTAVRLPAPDAVSVNYNYIATGRVIASTSVTDAQTVADAYAIATSLPQPDDQELHYRFTCGLHDPQTDTEYVVRFTHHGTPVLTVTRRNICAISWYWTLSRSGQDDELRSDRNQNLTEFMFSVLPSIPGLEYPR
jgi:hypothetical protein